MIENITIDYAKENDKYYLVIDGTLVGKFYDLPSCIKSLYEREISEKK